jgi:hypothetical protein
LPCNGAKSGWFEGNNCISVLTLVELRSDILVGELVLGELMANCSESPVEGYVMLIQERSKRNG